jgi:hypothetical protein
MKSLVTASGPEIHTLRIDGELGSIETRDGRTVRVFGERDDWRGGERLIQHELSPEGRMGDGHSRTHRL